MPRKNTPDIPGTDCKNDARKTLREGRSALAEGLAQASSDALPFEHAYSRLLDTYFRLRLAELGTGHDRVALVAVGGYGRQELCPASDIDILVLCNRSIPPQAIDLAQALFLPLWDEGFTLGHGFRTVSDCVKLAAHDHKVLASLLDARLVAGSPALLEDMVRRLDERVLPRRSHAFLSWLDTEHERRLAAHGDGTVLLEPNLKEGLGGLRDYHRILWLARIRGKAGTVEELMAQAGFSSGNATLLRQAVTFLHGVRNRLHLLSGRKNDTLFLDLQPGIAQTMGFHDDGGLLGVERFLGALHRCMSDIKGLSDAFRGVPGGPVLPVSPCPEVDAGVVIAGGAVHLCLPDGVEASPRLTLETFVRAAASPSGPTPRLDWNTRRRMAAAIAGRASELSGVEVGRALIAILTSARAFDVLEQMDAVGLLPALLPAYGAARDRVQFDGFHSYPAGMHTLFTIRQLEQLATNGPEPFATLWRECPEGAGGGAEPGRLSVLLAALFHDLGKGLEDASHHEESGAGIARDVLSAWGLPAPVVDDVTFLVREHLLLMRTAQRRDLNDEAVVGQVAGIVGDRARLERLLLLSYADASATGPKAWNRWAASLLDELRGKTLNMLRDVEAGGIHTAGSVGDVLARVRTLATHQPTTPPLGEDIAAAFLAAMPPRYVVANDPERILRHMEMARQLNLDVEEARKRLEPGRAERGLVVMEGRPVHGGRESDLWEVTILARDQQGLFATLAGVVALHGLNVYAADAFVWRDGTALDVFHVTAPPDPLYAREFWGKVRSSVQYAMTGKLALDYRLEEARASRILPDALREALRRPAEVRVDNGLSDFYTVIDVFAPDRPALLYDVARTLQSLHLDVLFAKVSTLGNRTADTFSVRTAQGQKLTDEEHLAEVRAALLHAVASR